MTYALPFIALEAMATPFGELSWLARLAVVLLSAAVATAAIGWQQSRQLPCDQP